MAERHERAADRLITVVGLVLLARRQGNRRALDLALAELALAFAPFADPDQ